MRKLFFLFPALVCIVTVQAQYVGIGTATPVAQLHVQGIPNTPSIPGAASTGILRIGVSSLEGIDIGKMPASPFSAWIQAGYNNIEADPLSLQPSGGKVGIGTLYPQAALDINSTSQGFLPPRMDSVQRNAIVAPATGLTIYNTSINAFQVYNGTSWYSTVHFVGEYYGGGIVCYTYDNGQHGLVVSTEDLFGGVPIRWNAGTNIQTRASAWPVESGRINTAIIISSQGYGDGDHYAALVCHLYLSLVDGVTYGGWYLPSRSELGHIYQNRAVIPGLSLLGYWSSSESGAFITGISKAWMLDFNGNGYYETTKSSEIRVRAVRSF